MANKKVVVDPVTRIEGHLRMQAVLDENNVIVDAMSTGTMWRGLEVILKGRDPRDAWAFVERICGVCTGIHALSAVRAVEDALGIKIPKNANIIRNLMNATLYCQDHLTHFYQLHGCDWIDVVSALSADPKKTSEIQQSISTHALSSPAYFKEVQDRLKAFVASGQLGIFANAYWATPATSFLRKLTFWASLTTSKAWTSSAKSLRSTLSSAVRTRTRTIWSAAFPARLT